MLFSPRESAATTSLSETTALQQESASWPPQVNPRDLVARAQALRADLASALAAPSLRQRSAQRALEAARDDLVNRQLADLPLARLRETTQGRLRLGAIERAGYRTVAQAAAAGRYRLEQIPGVGPQTATQVLAAASQLRMAMSESVRMRFDAVARPTAQTKLLEELYEYDIARRSVGPISTGMTELAGELDAVLATAGRSVSRWKMFFSSGARREQARTAFDQLVTIMKAEVTAERTGQLRKAIASIDRPHPDSASLWHDYEQRGAAYNGLLIEIGDLEADVESSHGFIPADIAQRVTQQPLDLSLMRVSLRGYQVFGAKFALAQGKAILGDEMGLGKSVEALAALCHLYQLGKKHALVVCPASVLVNWEHEIRRHSELCSFRLHGIDRHRNFQAWSRLGGVGVTTYDALRSLPAADGTELAMLVVDEAHYAKNPTAGRTQAVRKWVNVTRRVLYLTGTPMENRVEEFRTLVGHLRPDLVHRINAMDGILGAQRFRQAVAPVYLRRNQSDVLQELPPRLESEEWVELQGADLHAYRAAVESGNFMAMRRAAYASGDPADSAKLTRLLEIIDEASSNGRKIVVFSFFRDVLETVAHAIDERVFGPLTGGMSPTSRQALVDEFTACRGSAVLVSQIQAGGVGLNIQAASVVILTEPQWKPTTEDQAIARCHRMGQVYPVDVHRLLAADSVDQRMLEILSVKAALFDEYVRRSELKDISPDAIDISDMDATKDASTQAQAEYRIIEMERKRLHLDSIGSKASTPDSQLGSSEMADPA